MSESSVCNNIKLEELEKYQNEFYYMLSKWKNLKSNEQKLTLLLILVNILSKLNAVKAVKGDSPEKFLQFESFTLKIYLMLHFVLKRPSIRSGSL
jgi:hypothetical protein